MPRPLRIEYPGALYHVMSRGDRREAIYRDDQDRECFLETLGEACGKTGWQVHAWCLLGTFTGRFNRRHRWSGHLFGGRYKAQPIDERSGAYLVTACDYVHLNPARARLLAPETPLEAWQWSSYPAYLHPVLRTPWLRVDRVFGEHGLAREEAASRREYAERVEWVRAAGVEEASAIRSRWWHGAEDFVEQLAERMGRRGVAGERALERHETDEQLAARLLQEGLVRAGLDEKSLEGLPKGDRRKVAIARQLREQTPMTRPWIAARLRMGSASYLSALLAPGSVNSKL